MPRKTINVQSVETSVQGEPNNSQTLTITDASGLKRDLKIHPKAQTQLLHHLLATQPVNQSRNLPEHRSFRIQALSRYQVSGGNVGLALYLEPDIAIHVQMPDKLRESLIELLQTFYDDSSWSSSTSH